MAKDKTPEFRPQSKNANLHTQRGTGMLERSIEKDGFIGAITAAADGEVFDGSLRLETSFPLFDGVDPIIVRSKGDRPIIHIREDIESAEDDRAKRLSVAANRVAEVSLNWDAEVLADWDAEVGLDGFWLEDEVKPWEVEEAEYSTPEEDEETTADLIEQAEQSTIQSRVKPGEIWALGRHRICCADSTIEANVKGLLGDRTPQIVWADPPYGISIVATNGYVGGGQSHFDKTGKYYIQESKGLGSVGGTKPFGSSAKKQDVRGSIGASNIIPVGKYAPIIGDDTIETAVKSSAVALSAFPSAIHFWWGGNYYAQSLPNSSCWIIWDKENTGNFADAEIAWSNSPTAVRIFRHMWNGLMKASEQGQRRVHPTQKPIALCEWAFEKYGSPNDIIFDPFLGSAPSIIAAQEMVGDRTVYGCELSPEYCEVICRRYEEFTGQVAERVSHL
jgi:hypothetical protein